MPDRWSIAATDIVAATVLLPGEVALRDGHYEFIPLWYVGHSNMKRLLVRRPYIFVIVVTFIFMVLGLGSLWILNWYLSWNLDLFEKNSVFFQAWIFILQTSALIATLIYIGLQARETHFATRINTVQLMVTAHRELLGRTLDHPELFKAMSENDN